MLPVIIGIVVVVVIVCTIAGIYNNMVTKRNRIDNAWQNIDTQLQRRNDLIPNLVETVKGYAKHEQDTLAAVARTARPARAEGEGKRRAELTDMEAIETLARMFGAEEQTLALRREYFTRMKDRLTPQQLVVVFERGDYDGKSRPQQRSDGRRPNGGQFRQGGFGGGAPDGDFDER